ncbi:GNAT family N-acetyltransferase [Pseudokineococcus marinus]|uniref:GNAT family N-acetyltransferase n=1 Tax=Pseudokineococcus marinus TaxID=351215 RepID=A0A849BN16_9ACTN|nr:GNAT family N-acetyltransferase [Pseudokineococcus marinus]NNH24051.1 GNAT family N-acetyltransferase [Pseudokineococcus marinus]
MSRSIGALSLEHVAALPDPCRSCVRWELDAPAADAARRSGDPAFEKEAWLSRTLLEWGSCGRVVHVDRELAAFVTYAPPHLVPRSLQYPTSPVSADAVLLMTAGVLPGHRGGGLGRMLVQAAAKDLTRRGVRAVEAFAEAGGGEGTAADALPPTSGRGSLDVPAARLGGGCHVPAGFLREVGFEVVRDHPRWPRLRLELRTALAWREDVERALDRILADLRVPALG